jgi:TrmH family RNA methyltransferase
MEQLPRIKAYQKKFGHSYTLGTYPTIDLLKYKPEQVMQVFIHNDAEAEEGIQEITELCQKHGIKIEYNSGIIEKIAAKGNTYAMGVFMKYEDNLSEEKNHIVLVEPRNLGNIGAIVRSMTGFGFEDLAIIRNAADIFDPMVVRSAMGALFQTRVKYYDAYEEYMEEFSHNQYLFMLDGAKKLDEVEYSSPYSLVFGNESRGLPTEFRSYGEAVFIPHSDAIDSLNLSIAAAIAMYEVGGRS